MRELTGVRVFFGKTAIQTSSWSQLLLSAQASPELGILKCSIAPMTKPSVVHFGWRVFDARNARWDFCSDDRSAVFLILKFAFPRILPHFRHKPLFATHFE